MSAPTTTKPAFVTTTTTKQKVARSLPKSGQTFTMDNTKRDRILKPKRKRQYLKTDKVVYKCWFSVPKITVIFLKQINGYYEKFTETFEGKTMNFSQAEISCRKKHGEKIKILRYE